MDNKEFSNHIENTNNNNKKIKNKSSNTGNNNKIMNSNNEKIKSSRKEEPKTSSPNKNTKNKSFKGKPRRERRKRERPFPIPGLVVNNNFKFNNLIKNRFTPSHTNAIEQKVNREQNKAIDITLTNDPQCCFMVKEKQSNRNFSLKKIIDYYLNEYSTPLLKHFLFSPIHGDLVVRRTSPTSKILNKNTDEKSMDDCIDHLYHLKKFPDQVKTSGVIITNKISIAKCWKNGYFGKGNLSRSIPTWNSRVLKEITLKNAGIKSSTKTRPTPTTNDKEKLSIKEKKIKSKNGKNEKPIYITSPSIIVNNKPSENSSLNQQDNNNHSIPLQNNIPRNENDNLEIKPNNNISQEVKSTNDSSSSSVLDSEIINIPSQAISQSTSSNINPINQNTDITNDISSSNSNSNSTCSSNGVMVNALNNSKEIIKNDLKNNNISINGNESRYKYNHLFCPTHFVNCQTVVNIFKCFLEGLTHIFKGEKIHVKVPIVFLSWLKKWEEAKERIKLWSENSFKYLKNNISLLALLNIEYLQLSLQEAFFLKYAIGCLSIKESNKILNIEDCWMKFRENVNDPCDPFILKYVVYHYYRSKGWVVRDGLKYGTDYVIYQKGPVFSHSEYAISIIPVTNKNSNQDYNTIASNLYLPEIHEINCTNRVCTQVVKKLIYCYVVIPKNIDLTSVECLKDYQVYELRIKRWNPKRTRS